MPVRCGSVGGSRMIERCSSKMTRQVETPSPPLEPINPSTNSLGLSVICERNRGGHASKPRRTADDLHRHFRPTQAKTDASVCAWIAVDTKTVLEWRNWLSKIFRRRRAPLGWPLADMDGRPFLDGGAPARAADRSRWSPVRLRPGAC
jgi:hypothetical protein